MLTAWGILGQLLVFTVLWKAKGLEPDVSGEWQQQPRHCLKKEQVDTHVCLGLVHIWATFEKVRHPCGWVSLQPQPGTVGLEDSCRAAGVQPMLVARGSHLSEGISSHRLDEFACSESL